MECRQELVLESQNKKRADLLEVRCKKCGKLLFKYAPHSVTRKIEIVCTRSKCKYKNVMII